MARKRYLKPGFFKDEELASLPPLVRILFEGLWCQADREGRLKDEPILLKGEILPYDKINVDGALTKLHEKNFIVRYKIFDGKKERRFIEIINFKKHQDVHINEQPSTIPAPCKDGASTVQVPSDNGTSTPLTYTLTSTLNLDLVVDDVDNARKVEIENVIKDYTLDDAIRDHKQQDSEKEKSSAKKEKAPLPSTEEMITKIVDSKTCHWGNVVEFYLANGAKWNKINDAEKQVFYDRRAELFKKFYATKQDFYNVRLPSCNEIAQNFYNWIPSELNREKLQTLNNSAIYQAKNGKQSNRGATAVLSAMDGITMNKAI